MQKIEIRTKNIPLNNIRIVDKVVCKCVYGCERVVVNTLQSRCRALVEKEHTTPSFDHGVYLRANA